MSFVLCVTNKFYMLSVILLNVVMLNVAAPIHLDQLSLLSSMSLNSRAQISIVYNELFNCLLSPKNNFAGCLSFDGISLNITHLMLGHLILRHMLSFHLIFNIWFYVIFVNKFDVKSFLSHFYPNVICSNVICSNVICSNVIC